MKDEQKSACFKELKSFTPFEAQIALEDETYQAKLTKLVGLDLLKGNVELEYARLRGALEVLRELQNNRERLIELARSRNPNS